MANARIVSLLREGQKLVFGDTEEVAWRLMVLGGFISLNTGYAHDLPADLRREIVAVNEHFVEWCELTNERVTQQGVRDEEYTLYCQLDNELSALAREVRKVKFDKGQHIQCANCLKGSYVGYYAAAYGGGHCTHFWGDGCAAVH